MNKLQLERKMWNMNYNYDAIYEAQFNLDIINEELDKGEDLETILDGFGIFHRRIRN